MNTCSHKLFKHLSRLIALVFASTLLVACGGGSGEGTEPLPNTGTVTATNYNGPAPATDDVQAFKLNVWDNLVSQNRCGNCHGTGTGFPFVRSDNINLAYVEANKYVNLSDPSESLLVTKVGDGHNCWQSSSQVCADILVQYISRWAGASGGETTRVPLNPLSEDELVEPGGFELLAAEAEDYRGLWELFTGEDARCYVCHSRSGSGEDQSPFFAEPGEANLASSFAEAKPLIAVPDVYQSRWVERLLGNHNCWPPSCQANADEVAALISSLPTDTINELPNEIKHSKALYLETGTPASSNGRHQANLIALWDFKEGDGYVAADSSGLEPAIDLTLYGEVNWVGGWGIQIVDGKAQGSTASSKKLHDLIRTTGEYTIETWVAPANVSQMGPAVIVGYGGSDTRRNFTLGQNEYSYEFLHRSSTTDLNGEPSLSTMSEGEILQATLQHVVATFSVVDGRKIYVNGRLIIEDGVTPGNLNDWDDTFALVLGSEPSGANSFSGTYRMVAIHNRVLTETQVRENFDAGVGQKFYLQFSVSHIDGLPDNSYIVFEVSQFDNSSYLFNAPFFIILDSDEAPQSIPLRDMSIGVNAEVAKIGQAYSTLDLSLNASDYSSDTGQLLSDVGTVIKLVNGPETDQFFLAFGQLGNESGVTSEPGIATDHLQITLSDDQPVIGIRNFEEINATMSKLTGITADRVKAKFVFDDFEKTLPANENPGSFSPANQIAVTQLAIEYCGELIDNDSVMRDQIFGTFPFSGAPFTDNTDLINSLTTAFIGENLTNQPDITSDTDDLITALADCSPGCNAADTTKIVKSVCAAVLGSASIMVQ